MRTTKSFSRQISFKVVSLSFFLFACFCSATPFINAAVAADVTLAWDANSEGNLAGYKLYYDGDSDTEMYAGVGLNEGDSPIVIYIEDLEDADAPTFTVSGLQEGNHYYFALTAFDTDGLESDFSDEVGVEVEAADAVAITASGTTMIAAAVSSDDSGNGSGSGGGCFITGTISDDVSGISAAAAGILLLIALMVGILVPSPERKRK